MTAPKALKQPVSERAYMLLREKAIMFGFQPNEPLVESVLAAELSISRTPLRSALNRLASEGFLERTKNRGFRCRSLNPQEIFDLYEVRRELETFIVRQSCSRADDAEIAALKQFCQVQGRQRFNEDIMRQLTFDETFHERLAATSGNYQFVHLLRRLNARIRFARWIDMKGRLDQTDKEHKAIVDALEERNAEQCEALLKRHIDRRMDQIQDVIKEGYARIFLGNPILPESI